MFKKLLLGGFIGTLPLVLGVGGLPVLSQTQESVLGGASEQITKGYTIAQAAENISEQDLEKFAETVKKQRDLAQETERKMLEVLENEGLSGQRFQEIAKQKSNPAASTGNFSDEDLEKFENVFPEVRKIAQEDRLKQRELVKSQGFTIQEFNAIATKVQDDPSLQREVLKLMSN